MVVAEVPFPKPGLLYRLFGNDQGTEATYIRVSVEDGRVLEELVSIGPSGPGHVDAMFWGPEDELQRHLEGLHADLIWARTGEGGGRYAAEPVDLDGLAPAARQEVLDGCAADLEARREPLFRPRVPVPEPASVPEPPAGERKRSRFRRSKAKDDVAPAGPGPVADVEVERPRDLPLEAARDLAILIWGSIPVPRSRFAPDDGALSLAVSKDWLAVTGGLVTRGGVDPRPEPAMLSAYQEAVRWGLM